MSIVGFCWAWRRENSLWFHICEKILQVCCLSCLNQREERGKAENQTQSMIKYLSLCEHHGIPSNLTPLEQWVMKTTETSSFWLVFCWGMVLLAQQKFDWLFLVTAAMNSGCWSCCAPEGITFHSGHDLQTWMQEIVFLCFLLNPFTETRFSVVFCFLNMVSLGWSLQTTTWILLHF